MHATPLDAVVFTVLVAVVATVESTAVVFTVDMLLVTAATALMTPIASFTFDAPIIQARTI